MPITLDQNAIAALPVTTAPEETGLLEQAGAALRTTTLPGIALGSLQRNIERENAGARDPNFNVLDHLTLEEMASPWHFGEAGNADELAVMREQRARAERTREALANGPVNPYLMSFVAGFADPTNYIIPGFGTGASMGVRIAKAAGENLLVGGAQSAAMASLDPDFSWQDAAIATVAAGGVGAVFRGAVEAVGAARAHAKISEIGQEAAALLNDKRTVVAPESAGAAALRPDWQARPENTEQVASALRVAREGSLLPIAEQVGNSEFASSRQLLHEFIDTGTLTKGALEGERAAAPALHVQNAADNGDLVALRRGIQLEFDNARRTGALPAEWGTGKAAKRRFNEEIAVALNTGDVHPVPAVEAVAKSIRKNILEPRGALLEKSGMIDLPGFVKGAKSYFPRVFDIDGITRGKTDKFGQTFEDALTAYFQRIAKTADDKDYAPILAKDISRKLRTPGPHGLPRFTIKLRGSEKERVFDAPYEVLAPWLDHNTESVLGRYMRSTGPDARLFGRYGSLDAEEIIAKPVRDELEAARAALQADPDMAPAEKAKRLEALSRRADRDIELLTHVLNDLRGLRARSNLSETGRTAAKVVKTAGFMSQLGMVALAQIPDMATVILKEGLGRTFGSAVTTFGQGLRGLKTLNLKDAQRFGAALEGELNNRANFLFSIQDEVESTGRLDRALAVASSKAATWFGLNAMTVTTKSIAAGAAATRILENAQAVAAAVAKRGTEGLHPDDVAQQVAREVLSKADLRRMAQNRLTGGDLLKIAEQSKHFQKEGFTIAGNVAQWTDPKTRQTFGTALAGAVEGDVLTPNVGDAPMWAGTSEAGKMFLTYKRFLYAAYHRIAVAGMQQRDASTLFGFTALVGAGMLSAALYDVVATGKVKERSAADWIIKGVDRSGIASFVTEPWSWAQTLGAPGLEILPSYLMAGSPEGRKAAKAAGYPARTFTEQLTGPLGSYLDKMFATSSAAWANLAEGKPVTEAEVHKATRLLPFRNMLGLGYMIDQLEHAGARHGWYKPLPTEPQTGRM